MSVEKVNSVIIDNFLSEKTYFVNMRCKQIIDFYQMYAKKINIDSSIQNIEALVFEASKYNTDLKSAFWTHNSLGHDAESFWKVFSDCTTEMYELYEEVYSYYYFTVSEKIKLLNSESTAENILRSQKSIEVVFLSVAKYVVYFYPIENVKAAVSKLKEVGSINACDLWTLSQNSFDESLPYEWLIEIN